MVKIIKTKVAQNKDGKSFVSLKLQGDAEFVQSQQTGKWYLTVRTAYISCTFDEATASALIGKEMPGTIERVPCDPYEYTVESTGEIVTLLHRYEYRPEPQHQIEKQLPEETSSVILSELRDMGY